MSRRPPEIRAAMAAAARLTAFDADHTWWEVLFAADLPALLARPDDPDRALLNVVVEEYAEADRHADTLPDRAHLDWIERILAVPRLPAVPDGVVVNATIDPKLAPAVIAKGTVLRGGKDAAGAERRYVTTDTLTAYGATVAAVRSQIPGSAADGDPAGQPGLLAEAPAFPLAPAAGTAAPHTLRLSSPQLAFERGSMAVQVGFHLTAAAAASAADPLSMLEAAQWHHVNPDLSSTPATVYQTWTRTDVGTGATVVGVGLTLESPRGVPDGAPWLEVDIPPTSTVPVGFAFTRVDLSPSRYCVAHRAFSNDSPLDVSHEFQPFGATPRAGDALYLRNDEAFGGPLSFLSVTIKVLEEGTSPLAHEQGGIVPSTGASIDWQRRTNGRWETLPMSGPTKSTYLLAGSTTWQTDYTWNWAGSTTFDEVTIGDDPGRFIRGLLRRDFGWTAYQNGLAAFATAAVRGDRTATMPVPPTAPVFLSVAFNYTTENRAVTTIESVNGWAHTVHSGSEPFEPYTLAVPGLPAFSDQPLGMVAVGLALPDSAIGSSVSVYFEVDSASQHGSSEAPDAWWEWWDGQRWQQLPVADGTRQLRDSGLLRFVAPAGWARGCTDVGVDPVARTSRWLRLVTRAPERIGVVTAVIPDAVLAELQLPVPGRLPEPSPATILPPGTIKGPLSPIPGVKKVTNLAGVRGRGPEEDAAFRRRAAALVRHRGRAITPWDYQEIIATEFPEVAHVRCLPHTAPDGSRSPGTVALVVVPDRPLDPAPRPSVSLSERIADLLARLKPVHAHPVVIGPLYVPVTIEASVVLRRGVAALTGKDAITEALERWLHPARTGLPRWGQGLYMFSFEAFLEGLPEVDSVSPVLMRDPNGDPTDAIVVDACRGLYHSSRAHLITVREQL